MSRNSAFIYAIAIFLASFLGCLVPLFVSSKRDKLLKLFISFGAGLLLGMSFLHMLPESSHLLPHSFGIWFLGGFVLLLVLERFVMVHACEEGGCHYHTIGLAAFLGLTIHGLIEGIALGSSLVLPPLAFLVLIAILAHKGPSGFALTSILRLAGKSKKEIILFSIGVSLSGPLGLALAFLFIHTQDYHFATGALLALSAGTFVYIGACDLLPEVHHADGQKLRRLFAFLVGLALSFLSGFFLEHSH